MFKQKNALIAVAVAVLVAACGGGGGGDDTTAGNAPPPGGGTNQGGSPVADVALKGTQTLTQIRFNDTVGVDMATFGGSGVYGLAPGATAPIRNFGVRLMPEGLPAGGTTGNGHIAIEIKDKAANSPQLIQLMIDKVDYQISDQDGNWTVAPADSAKLYVNVGTKSGTAAMTVGALPKTLVTPVDPEGDPSSHIITFDIDGALTHAKSEAEKAGDAAKVAVFNSLKSENFNGNFAMSAAYSGMTFHDQASGAKLDLAAPGTITVNGQTVSGSGTTGSGVAGNLQIGTPAP